MSRVGAGSGADIRVRVRELKMVPASQLVPSSKNFRRHSERQRAVLNGILEEVGFAGAVLARELGDGRYEIIDGHLRADVRGDEPVPVLVTDLDADEAAKVMMTHDAIGGMAEIDILALGELADEIEFEHPDLDAMFEELFGDSIGAFNIGEVEPPNLPDGEKSPFQQMTFTLHDSQVATINSAIARAKEDGHATSAVNENSNGNALAWIAKCFSGES